MSFLPPALSDRLARIAKIKKAAAMCLCVALSVGAVLAITFITLYFAVLRGRPPQVVAKTDTHLNSFLILPPALNLSLSVEVTLRNPNHARFRYGEVVTAVTYHGTAVGRSTAPAGAIAARSAATVGAPVRVDARKVALHKLYAVDVLTGALPFQAAAAVAGSAAVLRPFRVRVAARVSCDVVVYPFRRESSPRCTSTVQAT